QTLLIGLLLVGTATADANAQEKKDDDAKTKAIHNELREFRESLTDAVLKKDFVKQLEHVTDDVVITWQNGEVVRGKKALKEFIDKSVAQDEVFQGYKEKPTPADLTILY